jgi:hypothetical protein
MRPKAGTIRARSETRVRSRARPKARPTPAAGPPIAATNALSVRVISFAMPPNSMRIQRQIAAAPSGAVLDQRTRPVADHAQVAAGREGGAGSREDDRLDGRVGRQLGQPLAQLDRQRCAEGVQRRRIVHGHDGVAAVALDEDESAALAVAASINWS